MGMSSSGLAAEVERSKRSFEESSLGSSCANKLPASTAEESSHPEPANNNPDLEVEEASPGSKLVSAIRGSGERMEASNPKLSSTDKAEFSSSLISTIDVSVVSVVSGAVREYNVDKGEETTPESKSPKVLSVAVLKLNAENKSSDEPSRGALIG